MFIKIAFLSACDEIWQEKKLVTLIYWAIQNHLDKMAY